MATEWNKDRWTGKVNEAGDLVYERNTAAPKAPAKKKPAAKKKA